MTIVNELKNNLSVAQAALEQSKKDGEYLASVYPVLDEIEKWCKDIRVATHELISSGGTVPGYKLVAGKQGNRAVIDEAALLRYLKTTGLKDTEYQSIALKSPAQLEKGIKKKLPLIWTEMEKHFTRPDGKPAVAPESDPRPAITPVVDEFESLS